MARIRQEAIDYQVKRFMRPDAHRYLRPDWRKFWPKGSENDPLYRYYASLQTRDYDPKQPRVPPGQTGGGRWASLAIGIGTAVVEGAANNEGHVQRILTQAKVIAAAARTSYQKCLNLCFPLLERFQPSGSDRNQWDFHKCMNVCLGR